jgi:hypothetical protein
MHSHPARHIIIYYTFGTVQSGAVYMYIYIYRAADLFVWPEILRFGMAGLSWNDVMVSIVTAPRRASRAKPENGQSAILAPSEGKARTSKRANCRVKSRGRSDSPSRFIRRSDLPEQRNIGFGRFGGSRFCSSRRSCARAPRSAAIAARRSAKVTKAELRETEQG